MNELEIDSRKKRPRLFLAVIFCFLALLFQATVPPMHLYLEALEPIDEHEETILANAAFGLIQAPDETGHHHDESTCPICKSLIFHHVSGTLTLSLVLIFLSLGFIATIYLRTTRFKFLVLLIRCSRAPPFLLV